MKLYRIPLFLSTILFIPAALVTASATAANAALPNNQQWVSLSAVNNNVVWVGSDNGHVALSTDAGVTFELSKLPTNAKVRQLIVIDDHHGYALTSGAGELCGLYITRNGGFSWRPLYRGSHQEQLRCMAINPDGEAWILGDTQNDHWHVVRSNNGKHWNSSRSGFEQRPLQGEQASNSSDSCVRFENNTWLMGTQNANVARLMHKEGTAFRFQILDTPITVGSEPTLGSEQGITAVWPLSPAEFLIAGGNNSQGQLFQYQQKAFKAVPTPAFTSAIQVLYQQGQKLYIGNEQGAYVTSLEKVRNGSPAWQPIIKASIGARAFTCGTEHCWLLGTDNNLHTVNP